MFLFEGEGEPAPEKFSCLTPLIVYERRFLPLKVIHQRITHNQGKINAAVALIIDEIKYIAEAGFKNFMNLMESTFSGARKACHLKNITIKR
jgi:hypothetical protein